MKYSTFIGLMIIALLTPSCEAIADRLINKIKNYFNPFGYIVDLGLPIKDFKFTYILIRSSFRPPGNTQNTFPSDQNYKWRWTKEQLTKTGIRQAKMLGRSVEDKYGIMMDIHWVERTRPVRTSALDKPYGESAAEAFEEGYMQDYRERFGYAPFVTADFDKTALFENSMLCPAYASLLDTVQKTKEKDFLARPTNPEFLAELRKNVGAENPNDEWYIDSLKKVYWLREILDLEKALRNKKPRWMNKNIQDKLDEFVLEYLEESIHGDAMMTKYVVGPLLNEILERDKDGYTRLHVHVTDERTFAAFKSVISEKPPAPVQFGEMIIFDVDVNRNVMVTNFLPMRTTLMQIPVEFKNLNEYKNRFSNYLLPEKSWDSTCNNRFDNQGSSYGTEASTASKPVETLTTTTHAYSYGGVTRSSAPVRRESTGYLPLISAPQPAVGSYPIDPTPTPPSKNPPGWTAPSSGGTTDGGTTVGGTTVGGTTVGGTTVGGTNSWYNPRWHSDYLKSQQEYYEIARANREGKKEKPKKAVIRPVIKDYTPWQREEAYEVNYSSEEDPSSKSRGREYPDQNGAPSGASDDGLPVSSGFGSYGSRSAGLESSVGQRAPSDDRFDGWDSTVRTAPDRFNDRLNPTYSDPSRRYSSYLPSPIVQNSPPPQKPTKARNMDDFFKDLPKNGEIASFVTDKTENGVRTVQRTKFKIVDQQGFDQIRSGCLDEFGKEIVCIDGKKIGEDEYLAQTTKISQHRLY